MAHTFNWALGHEGKGNVYDDGSISTWNTDPMRNPHHYQMGQQDEKTPRFHFYIEPNGGLWDGGTSFQNQLPHTDDQVIQQITQQHPAVWDGRNEFGVDWNADDYANMPEERIEMPGGGYGHAEDLMNMGTYASRTKIASEGWADFHTEFKIPRGVRKQLRRWVDRLKWPENHEKHDAREYHITVLDMDEYDADFAKWARKEVQGKELNFKSTGMEMFNDFVVVRLECPEWEELASKWTEEADRRGLEPHKFPGGPKAHVSVGRSHDKKWPQGIPNPHIKFRTRMFNIKRNSRWHEAAAGDPWQPGVWGKGMTIDDVPHVWETTSPDSGEMAPTHPDMRQLDSYERYPTKHNAPIVVAPDGSYAPAPHWGDWKELEGQHPDPLMQPEYDALNGRMDSFAQSNPALTRMAPEQWKEERAAEREAQEAPPLPAAGYGHAQNVMDILNDYKRVTGKWHISIPVGDEWWKEPRQQQEPWYHGTSLENAQRILSEGLKPWDSPDVEQKWGNEFEHEWLEPRPGHVYLTRYPVVAEDHAMPDFNHEEDPYTEEQYPDHNKAAILKIDPSYLKAENINPDEDSSPMFNKDPNGYLEAEDDHDYPTLGQWAEDTGYGNDPKETQKLINNTMAYRGAIPPEAISLHEVYDPITGRWGKPEQQQQALPVMASTTEPADDLAAWLQSFETEPAVAPSPHHTDGDQFAPQVVIPVVQTPHVDPPKKPYQPYNWAEEGWEESPMNMTAASEDEEMYVPGMAPTPITVNRIGWPQSTAKPHQWNWEPAGHEPSRQPFLFNRNTRTVHLGQPGMIHSEMYQAAGVPMQGDVGNEWQQGEIKHWPAELSNRPPWFIYGNPYKPDDYPEHREIYNAMQEHYPDLYDEYDAHTSKWHSHAHQCPSCGATIDGQICGECGYNPTHPTNDYDKAKSQWYDRAWSRPDDQPRPLEPMHWGPDDGAHDISLASTRSVNGSSTTSDDQQRGWHLGHRW